MIDNLAELERQVFDICVQTEPTILVMFRGHADGLCADIRVNLKNHQLGQSAMWEWRLLLNCQSVLPEMLAQEVSRMAERMKTP